MLTGTTRHGVHSGALVRGGVPRRDPPTGSPCAGRPACAPRPAGTHAPARCHPSGPPSGPVSGALSHGHPTAASRTLVRKPPRPRRVVHPPHRLGESPNHERVTHKVASRRSPPTSPLPYSTIKRHDPSVPHPSRLQGGGSPTPPLANRAVTPPLPGAFAPPPRPAARSLPPPAAVRTGTRR